MLQRKNKLLAVSQLAFLLAFAILPAKAQQAFSLKSGAAVSSISKTMSFTSNATITPFSGSESISGLSLDGSVEQKGDDSFVRVVLEDKQGNDYLVAEFYRALNANNLIPLNGYCQETALLGGVEPAKLKIYVRNAQLNLTKVNTSTASASFVKAFSASSVDNIQREQVQATVNSINAYNKAHKKLWFAGVTDVSLLPYSERKQALGFSDTDNTSGLEYYDGGIFEMGPTLTAQNAAYTQSNTMTSPYVDSFDWRNRHGKNWITSCKNQYNSGACWAFAAVGVTEALVNLYYNRKLDMDLSEQEIVSCSNEGDIHGGYMSNLALKYIANYGVSEEAAFPFLNKDTTCHQKNPNPHEFISLADATSIQGLGINYEDSLKKYLIKYGPLSSGFRYYYPGTSVSRFAHAMALVGYGVLHAGDSIVYINQDSSFPAIRINEGDPRINMTYWIFKNSGGPTSGFKHDGYLYVIFTWDKSLIVTDVKVPVIPTLYGKMPITSLNYTANDVVCADADGDGYYFWGLGPKPASCPSWVPDTPDGDDSNYAYGPMDEYGHLAVLNPDANDTIYITTAETWSTQRYLYRHVVIKSTGSLTITSPVTAYNGEKMIIESGGTLTMSGASLSNADLTVKSGAHVYINNGGIHTHSGKDFVIPQGALMRMSQGRIQ